MLPPPPLASSSSFSSPSFALFSSFYFSPQLLPRRVASTDIHVVVLLSFGKPTTVCSSSQFSSLTFIVILYSIVLCLLAQYVVEKLKRGRGMVLHVLSWINLCIINFYTRRYLYCISISEFDVLFRNELKQDGREKIRKISPIRNEPQTTQRLHQRNERCSMQSAKKKREREKEIIKNAKDEERRKQFEGANVRRG